MTSRKLQHTPTGREHLRDIATTQLPTSMNCQRRSPLTFEPRGVVQSCQTRTACSARQPRKRNNIHASVLSLASSHRTLRFIAILQRQVLSRLSASLIDMLRPNNSIIDSRYPYAPSSTEFIRLKRDGRNHAPELQRRGNSGNDEDGPTFNQRR